MERQKKHPNLLTGRFKPGQSGNPGGPPKLKNDLKRAALIGVPPEVLSTLEEWFEDAASRLAELGAEGFVQGLRAALTEATQKVLPLDPAEARAMWWRTVWPVFIAGPSGPKDSVWVSVKQDTGDRLFGKAKEHVTISDDNTRAPIDWKRVPEEEREALLAAILKLQAYTGEPETPTEH